MRFLEGDIEIEYMDYKPILVFPDTEDIFFNIFFLSFVELVVFNSSTNFCKSF